jgi:hypothetical protein
MRAIAAGLGAALDECQDQFARERWNCSTTFDFGLGPMRGISSFILLLHIFKEQKTLKKSKKINCKKTEVFLAKFHCFWQIFNFKIS